VRRLGALALVLTGASCGADRAASVAHPATTALPAVAQEPPADAASAHDHDVSEGGVLTDGGEEAGVPPARRVIVGPDPLGILESVPFEPGSAKLPKNADVILRAVVTFLARVKPGVRVEVAGHAVAKEGAAGTKLAQQRADRVRAALIGLGIDAERLVAVGHAWEEPPPESVAPAAPWNPVPPPPPPDVRFVFIDDPTP
jgi:outer membrane protein OmpA-like peptidoglycan-associated protein